MFFCAWSITASRSLSFCRLSVVCLVAVCIEVPRCCGDGVEPLVHRALQLRLRLGQQLAHRLDPRAELDDALVGELRRGGVLGGELRRGGSATGVRGRPTKTARPGDGEADDQAEGDKEGGFHERVLRDSLGRERRAAGFSTGTNREHIDRCEVQPLNRGPRCAWRCGTFSFCRTSGCGWFPSRSPRSMRRRSKLVEDMFETMYDAPGIGLAAIQIGEPRRVVTMDLAKKDEPKEPQVFINPEIVSDIRREEHPRGGLPVDPGILRGGRAAGGGQGPLSRSRRQAARDRGRRAAGDLPPARDRPSQRRAVHRSHLQAEARPRHQEIHQGGEARQASDQKRGGVSDAAPPDLHGHAGLRRADAARAGRAGPRHRGGLYARGRSPAAGAAWSCVPSPVEREARRLGLAVHDAGVAEERRRAGRVRRAPGRRRGRRRLWIDPAEADPRCAAARLLQPACLAAAALARRRADQPRHHGGRRRDRRHGDEDGRGARHRRRWRWSSACRSAPT